MAERASKNAQLLRENNELRARLRQLGDALENMSLGLCMFDSEGRIALFNPRYPEVLGLPAEKIHPGMTSVEQIALGVEAGHYLPGVTVDELERRMWVNLTCEDEARRPFRRGDRIYSVHPRRTPTGNLVATFEDITARTEAEKAVRESELRFSAMLDAMIECVKIFDGDGRLIYINPRGLELLEAPSLEAIDFADYVPVPEEYHDRAREVHRQVIAGEAVTWSYELISMTGRRFHVEATAVPFRLPDGTAAHLSISRDVNERQNAENALRRSEARLRLVQDVTGLADFEAGPDGTSIFSHQFADQAGLPPGTTSLRFKHWLDIIHPDDREDVKAEIERCLRAEQFFRYEYRIIRPDNGEIRWLSAITKAERDPDGGVLRTIGAHLDITARKRSEDALREGEERFRLAAEAAGMGVWDYDPQTDTRQWSNRLLNILGLALDVEPTLELAAGLIHPDERADFLNLLNEKRDGKGLNRFGASYRIVRVHDGALRWITLNGWRTESVDGLTRIILTIRDVTDEKTAEDRIRWTASHDALTRLANRANFQGQLGRALQAAKGTDKSIGLLMIDLDHFKQVNDALGHDAGDGLLRAFADRLRAAARPGDCVARLSGDEFAILAPDLASESELADLAGTIHEGLREPFIQKGRVLDCRASIGAAIFPRHGKTSRSLMVCADMALYAAKRAGRSTTTTYSPLLRDEVRRFASMVNTARKAVQENRIVPYYQPKLDLVTGAVIGFEALLRWRDAKNRIHLPATIEAAFEDHEVAAAISDRMIELAIADMRGWLEKGASFGHVALNASAAEFRRDDFAERVLDALQKARIPAECFQLEVTETVFLGRGAEYVQRALAMLSSAGVKIALDDFGTGYASLRHLKQFPVDILKIDKSFVRDMEDDPGDAAIIRAVVNLGKNLGIKVVAEGIENMGQARRLIEIGCDYGQGFLFSKAVPASRVLPLVARLPVPARGARHQPSGQGLKLVVGQN